MKLLNWLFPRWMARKRQAEAMRRYLRAMEWEESALRGGIRTRYRAD